MPLFSGSKGNSYYIGSATEGVLIDAGRSCRQIELAMESNGLDMRSVGALFITHEHIDHCAAVRVLAKKYDLPVYASAGTLRALEYSSKLPEGCKTFVIEDKADIGNMRIERFDTPHDAAESCCYLVNTADGKRALIATDMGYFTDEIRQAAQTGDFAVIESNHDIDMLKTGPYPYMLKKRILSDKGHLSNEACSLELSELVRSGTLRLMLGHLSEQNNTPGLALRTAIAELSRSGMKRGSDFTLDVAPVETNGMSVIF